jgi:hypothetical protein
MKNLTQIPLLFTMLFAGALPAWAFMDAPAGPCHNVDMYGIYQICGTSQEQHHDDHDRNNAQTAVYVTSPDPYVAPAPGFISTPASGFSSEPTPVSTDDNSSRRDLTAVDSRLHEVHLLLNDKQSGGHIASDFYDEESRYLAQIESQEQSTANANGGYLTVAQENTFLQQLQNIENEINQNVANNG